MQAVAAAATGFVAGAATYALARRYGVRKPAQLPIGDRVPRPGAWAVGETRTFIVRVRVIGRS
jgi:hypothetical protein